jgi:hypothetical protein
MRKSAHAIPFVFLILDTSDFEQWKEQSIEQLVYHWGGPNKRTQKGNQLFLTYTLEVYAFGAQEVDEKNRTSTSQTYQQRQCTVCFETDGEVVTGIQYGGNFCRLMGKLR